MEVVPVEVIANVPSLSVAPTVFANVIFPEPVLKLKFLLAPELELTVPAKLTLPDPVVIVEFVLRTTFPPKLRGLVEEDTAA